MEIRYWVKDVVTGTEGTITKTLSSASYDQNKYYNITANLDVTNYDGNYYYMWDAQEQYWKGHEWNLGGSQPTLGLGVSGATRSNDYPKSGESRYFNTISLGSGVIHPAVNSCAGLPNANEMSWYVMYGDPRWDEERLWTIMGHLYKAGMWFKKKSVLIAEHHYDTDKSADGTTDMRTTYRPYVNSNSSSINSGVPSAADASKYFYLPALGYYLTGEMMGLGEGGIYWLSSALYNGGGAYYLGFQRGSAEVLLGERRNGSQVQAFE